MNQPPSTMPWISPLDAASQLSDQCFVLLYSAVRTSYSGRYSLLAISPRETITANDFDLLGQRLSHDQSTWENAWFGYIGYGLKHATENLPHDAPGPISLPPLWMTRFHTVMVFDHEKYSIAVYGDHPNKFDDIKVKSQLYTPYKVSRVASNMTTDAYLEKVSRAIKNIEEGKLYQANITRKFMGEFAESPDPFAIYRRLCEVSPAPYSAYIKLEDTAIISSSPELFLRADSSGTLITRPIKGTAPRDDNRDKDMNNLNKLKKSSKDQAENLMIVDLMRNDLARSSAPGSVKTTALYEITSHATVHHMSSTIQSQKLQEKSTLDAIAAAFPPGSMTGAPKIAAMRLCSELEKMERGVYSGAIGWLGGDGSAELSVVIRTLIVNGKTFEFQVGGGIVADSTPESELQEIIDKAKGIAITLGIPPEALLSCHALNA